MTDTPTNNPSKSSPAYLLGVWFVGFVAVLGWHIWLNKSFPVGQGSILEVLRDGTPQGIADLLQVWTDQHFQNGIRQTQWDTGQIVTYAVVFLLNLGVLWWKHARWWPGWLALVGLLVVALWFEGQQNTILLGLLESRSISVQDARALKASTCVIVFNYVLQMIFLLAHPLFSFLSPPKPDQP